MQKYVEMFKGRVEICRDMGEKCGNTWEIFRKYEEVCRDMWKYPVICGKYVRTIQGCSRVF